MTTKHCRRCSECADSEHHFLFEDYASEYPEHPAAKAGHEAWYECKHCPAYMPVTDEVIDALEAEESISAFVVVPEEA